MHTRHSRSTEVAEIIMDRRASVFDLPIMDRLILVRHLLHKDKLSA